MTLVKAGELEGGQWFRKRTGAHRHLVISESAVRHHRLPEGQVYGVSIETGNMTAVDPDTLVVVLVDPFDREAINPWMPHNTPYGERCNGGPSCQCREF